LIFDVSDFLLLIGIVIPHGSLFSGNVFGRVVDERLELLVPELPGPIALSGLDGFAIPLGGFLVGERRVTDGNLGRLWTASLVNANLAEITVMHALLAQMLQHAVVVHGLLGAARAHTVSPGAPIIDALPILGEFLVAMLLEPVEKVDSAGGHGFAFLDAVPRIGFFVAAKHELLGLVVTPFAHVMSGGAQRSRRQLDFLRHVEVLGRRKIIIVGERHLGLYGRVCWRKKGDEEPSFLNV